MYRIVLLACFVLSVFTQSCAPEGHSKGWQPLDLLAHGPAVSIMAPADAQVKKGQLNSSLLSDLTIKGSDNYDVQLLYSKAISNDLAKLKNDQLEIVRNNRFFKRLVKEEEAGFVYVSMIDTVETYGFRYVKLQGDMELNFQNGLNGIFTLEEAQLMYEGVK